MCGKQWIQVLFVIAFITAVLYCIFRPAVQDYIAYSLHWSHILSGGDPWVGTAEMNMYGHNAYGPLYILFVLPFSIDQKLPRIIFTIIWFALAYWLIKKIYNSGKIQNKTKIILTLILILSPFLWLRTVHFGQFDIILAALSLWSIDTKQQNKSILSGILITLAIALKYYPIVFVPFIFFSERKPDFKFFFTFVVTSAVIFATTYLIWGDTFIMAIKYASARPSKMLSIFRFLRGTYSPLKIITGIHNVDRLSTLTIMISGFIIFIIYIRNKIDLITGSVIAINVTLLFYKVGHQQFHVLLYVLLVYWMLNKGVSDKLTFKAIMIYMLFINIYDIGYVSLSWYKFHWSFVREICGLFSFVIMSFLLYVLLYKQTNITSAIIVSNDTSNQQLDYSD
ncbi:MAG: DUF2029 domain-containing protein [Candidatus Latescibacteria bacterium]|nr:DUF2029 domain-containing protein [Candidatus Latescibacterota bacterium]